LELFAMGFKSFEETLVLAAMLVAIGVVYKLFKGSLLTSLSIGALSGLIVAYATFSEFTLQEGVITFRNRFWQTSFPVSSVEKVGMHTFWAGLPGHTFMFVMRSRLLQ
jgi:fluoride ion exporter CrcB/FEX